ncbi:NUDIX hydrolase [Methanobrevibacter sp. OttesenSCG-928-K11]|nr:NUDIX hydrolase [Methanobrevibacter sp. OttesenSCG-928-K11]MDL2270423.1 NUDIX hydrolase [Methanobrevibacter sp. OttesenSCG-928-I08]
MNTYRKPSLTVDIIIFNEDGRIILIKRKNNPYKNFWAIPGGFVEYGETVENAAIRECKEETNIDVKLVAICGVYSNPTRDPRGHTVTIAYIGKGKINNMKASSDALEIAIFSQKELENMNLAFDHAKILQDSFNLYSKLNK